MAWRGLKKVEREEEAKHPVDRVPKVRARRTNVVDEDSSAALRPDAPHLSKVVRQMVEGTVVPLLGSA